MTDKLLKDTRDWLPAHSFDSSEYLDREAPRYEDAPVPPGTPEPAVPPHPSGPAIKLPSMAERLADMEQFVETTSYNDEQGNLDDAVLPRVHDPEGDEDSETDEWFGR